MYVIDPGTGLPKKAKSGGGGSSNPNPFVQGEPKNDAPFTNPIITGTTSSASSPAPTITIPGFTPDISSYIQNDPALLQLDKDLAAQNVSDVASRNAAINRALVQFGTVPDLDAAANTLGISGLSSVVDPTTAALAEKNQYSTQAGLSRTLANDVHRIRQNLAARHALQSGELGYDLNQENLAYGQAQSDATQKLLDYIAGVQSAFTTAQQQRQMQHDQALADAAVRQASLHPPTGSSMAAYDAGASAAWGFPVYRDQNGHLFRSDGSPVSGVPAGGGSGSDGGASASGPANRNLGGSVSVGQALNIPGSPLDEARRSAGRGAYAGLT